MSFILLGILNAQAEAAGIESDYELLETTILGSSASSVDFTGLGSYTDYKHLQLRFVARRTDASTGQGSALMTLNGITTNNYAVHWLQGNGSSVVSNALTSRANIFLDNAWPRGSESSGIYNPGVIDILDFADTSKNTTIRALFGGTSSNENKITLESGLLLNTSAITSIELESDGSDIASGSRFSLYGLKESA